MTEIDMESQIIHYYDMVLYYFRWMKKYRSKDLAEWAIVIPDDLDLLTYKKVDKIYSTVKFVEPNLPKAKKEETYLYVKEDYEKCTYEYYTLEGPPIVPDKPIHKKTK